MNYYLKKLIAFKRKLSALTLLIISVVFCSSAYAAAIKKCTIDTTPLNFGIYYPMQNMRLDSTATLNVRCNGKSAATFQITTSAGLSNDYSLRTMFSGLDVLTYNLYIDAARTSIWGDGTTNTSIITGTHPAKGKITVGYPIYGSIGSAQNVNPGLYTDVITVTLFF